VAKNLTGILGWIAGFTPKVTGWIYLEFLNGLPENQQA
jgi:hypothetical protein